MHCYSMKLEDIYRLTLIQYYGLLNRVQDVNGKMTDMEYNKLKGDRERNPTW